MTEPTRDDITALRQEGDLGAYMRSLIRKPATTPPARAAPPPAAGHRTGAWPAGTQPPEPEQPVDGPRTAHATCDCPRCLAYQHPSRKTTHTATNAAQENAAK